MPDLESPGEPDGAVTRAGGVIVVEHAHALLWSAEITGCVSWIALRHEESPRLACTIISPQLTQSFVPERRRTFEPFLFFRMFYELWYVGRDFLS